MANLGTTFDATTIDPTTTYEIFPPGKYVVQIVGSEMRPTSNGLGQYLWLELDILEGEYAGRKLFDRLNLVNANTQTVEIAQRTLSANHKKVLRLIEAAGAEGLSRSKLYEKTHAIGEKRDAVLAALVHAGQIEVIEVPTRTKPRTVHRRIL